MLDPRVEAVLTDLGVVYNSDATPQAVKDWINAIANKLLETRDPLPGFNKGDPLPNALGSIADEYARVREMRLAVEKTAAQVKERETELYNVALSWLTDPTNTDTGASGTRYRVQKVKKVVQNVANWDSFYAFVAANKAFEMLQRRLSDKAVKDYQDATGSLPDGVEEKEIDQLSFTKV